MPKGRYQRRSDITRFWSKTRSCGSCLLWQAGTDKDGYGKFQTGGRASGGQRHWRAHRWIYERAVGPLYGTGLLHSCDTPGCVALQHLSPGTQQQNQAEKVRRRREARGDRHGRRKLTDAQVRWLREEVAKGRSVSELAEELSVWRSTIRSIVRRRTRRTA